MTRTRLGLLAALVLAVSAAFLVEPVLRWLDPCRGTGRVFLWTIRGQRSAAHVLGSIHFGKPDLYPLDRSIETAFAESERAVFEFDLNPESVNLTQNLRMLKGMLLDGSTLPDHLSPDGKRRLETFLAERDKDLGLLGAMRPWLAAMMLEMLEALRLGLEPAYSIDVHFMVRARKDGKEIVELESPSAQFDRLAALTQEQQELFLVYRLEELDTLAGELDGLLGSWADGNADGITSYLTDIEVRRPEIAPLIETIVYERSELMADAVRDLLARPGTSFVVVGSSHVVGPRGIVQILERTGEFEVTQQCAAGPGSIGAAGEPVDTAG